MDSKRSDFKDQVRTAASGRWPEILSTETAIPIDILDGQHHPCPKCGGRDRFRLIDESAGAVLCNQCFSQKNDDGFATLMWMTGCSFPEALEKVAWHLGIKGSKQKSASNSKPVADPAKDLVFQPWNSLLAAHFLAAKQGITEESLIAQGCKMANYKRQTVIVWPVIGPSLDTEKPVGYVVMEYKARPIPVKDRHGNVKDHVGKKLLFGSKPGLVGVDAINKMKTLGMVDTIWKAEGLTDQAALWAAIPEHLRDQHVVLSTSCGANENPKWMGDVLSNFNLNVLHDCDAPGQAGAIKWSQFVAGRIAEGKAVRNIVLPYDIEPTKGKDVRDWLNSGNKYGDLLNLVDRTEPIIIARTESGEIDPSQVQFPIQERILKLLQIEVLYELENGRIRVRSSLLKKSTTINQIDRLREDTLVQVCGEPAMGIVSSEPDDENTFKMQDIRKAIALAAARLRDSERQGGEIAYLANLIIKGEHFAKNQRGILHRYLEGCFRPEGSEFVNRRVKELCLAEEIGIEWAARRTPEVVRFILADAPLLDIQPSLELLNLRNGLLRLSDCVLLPHSHEHLSAMQLPVSYDPDAVCPSIEQFVSEVFPVDSSHVAWEIVAWLMTPNISIQKAILFLGPGGDGKSTFLRVIQEFLGSENCSSVSLHELESNRFTKSQLVGKLANICADLPTEDLQGTSIFKALTGGDRITGEDKNMPHFQFQPFARLVFSANSPPRSRDASEGFYDRWIIIPFENRFRDTKRCKQQHKLIAELTTESELSGLLNLSLPAWKSLQKSGAITTSKSMSQAHSEFRAATDPFAVWLESHIEDDPDAFEPKEKLRNAYGESCADAGRTRLSEKAVTRQLKRLKPHVKSKQRTICGKRPWCYVGIRLIDATSTAQVPAQDNHNFDETHSDHTELENKGKTAAAQDAQLISDSTLPHTREEEISAKKHPYTREKNGVGQNVVQPVQPSNGRVGASGGEAGRRVLKV